MEDGKKAIIYYIKLEDDYYVGSTTAKLCKRQANHNYDMKTKSSKLYKTARELGIEKLKCVWIEDVKYNSIEELRAREEYWRKKYEAEKNSNLNSLACFQTLEEKKEYQIYYNHLQETKDKKKKHYEDNKEKRKSEEYKEKQKIWLQKHRLNNKELYYEKNKKWNDTHKEYKKEYNKEYRLKNIEAIRVKQIEKKECPHCNKLICYPNLKRHITTQHKDIIP